MSTALLNDAPQPDVSAGSMQTLVPRPLPPHKDPITSKRVCFYKSGDPQFTGHRMVINSRTFKTFDALLDTLSKKLPLSFGVRTITTPNGTHAVHTLDDLQDGASYLCSDHRKVKPFNLDEVHKTQAPWNTTRPISAGRQPRRALLRQLVKRSEGVTRTVKIAENNVVVRTPKRLMVYKNKDPSIKRVIVLQRRTAPNFEALLDYLSKVMQFPVLKIYTEDGRKVEGLPGLILCSGIVVAAGNEPFRMGNYKLQGPTKTIQSNISESLGPTQTETLLERFLVEQINKSLNGSLSEQNWQKTESMVSEGSQPMGSEKNCDCVAGVEEKNRPIMPIEDNIEKSFRVNEDGSMTVEMKVHLTIKQEEMVHWTTTLSRTSVNSQQRAVGTSKPGSGMNSLDVPNDSGKESIGPHSLECKEINTLTDKSVGFIEEQQENFGSAVAQTSETIKPIYRRVPTPGHRQQRKEASVENIKRVSETEVQESTVGAYSYMERTTQGELTEGYCVVSHSSSSSARTLSKPSKSESGEMKQKKSHSFRSSGVADVLQLQNNRPMGITETVLHIYESQGTCDNYYANMQVDVVNKPEYSTKALPCSTPGSTDSGPRSSSNDCGVDLTRQSTSSNSGDGGKNYMLSLSSASSTPRKMISNNLPIYTDKEQQCRYESTEMKMLQPEAPVQEDAEDEKINSSTKTNTPNSKKSKKSTSSELSGPGKRIKGSMPGSSKGLQMTNTSDTLSHTGSEMKTRSSAESNQHKNKRGKTRKTKTFEGSPKSRNLNPNRRSEKELKLRDKTPKDISHKANTNDCDSVGPTLKTKVDNGSPVGLAPLKKMLPKQRSINGVKSKTSKTKQKLSESVSLPVLQSSPSNVNQYVENWLQKIQPDSLPYDDDMDHPENVPRAVFQIGSDSADVSEIKSEPENVVEEGPSLEDNAVERPMSRPSVQIRYEGEPLEAQKVRGFCKSMPSVRVLSVEQEDLVRMHKSSENLAPPDPFMGVGASQSTDVKTMSGMKPLLEQLCLSIQSIRQASSQNHLAPTVKEKSSSLPDFSSQVASAFGSPSRAFLSFLSLMTLRDGTSILGKDESQTSDLEALQVMQSLEKISNIKDEQKLKASLTSLQGSTSSQLKQSWRDFQEKNVFGESPPLSPKQSEQEFALDVDSGGEGEEQDEKHDFGIEQLMDELNMSDDLRREISSLVEGELQSQTNLNNRHFNNCSEMSGKEEENDDGSVNGSLEKAADMDKEKDYCEENSGLENDTSKDEIIDDLKELESQELQLLQSRSSDLETVEQDLVNDDSGIAVPNQTPEENCSDSSKENILETPDNKQIYTETKKEIVICEDLESYNRDADQKHLLTSQKNLTDTAEKDFPELSDKMSEGENNITADNVEKRNTHKEEEATIHNIREHTEQSEVSEPENTDATSQQKLTDLAGEEQPGFSDDQDNMSEGENNITPDIIEERDINAEQDTIQNIREDIEQSDVSEAEDLYLASETECMEFPDKETDELNEDNESDQFDSTEMQEQDCDREETEHSDFKEDSGDEGNGHEQENKLIISECESQSQDSEESRSLSHNHGTRCTHRVHVLESCSQEDDQVMSPDVEDAKTDQQKDAMSEISDCEYPDPHYNNSSPEHCSNDENSMTSKSDFKAEYYKTPQFDNGHVEENGSNDEEHEISELCEWVDPDAEAGSCTVSDLEAENVTAKTPRSSTSNIEYVCKAQTSEQGSLTNKKESSAEFCDEENSMLDSHEGNAIQQNSFMFGDNNNGFVERESCSSMKTNSSKHQLEELENLGMEHGYHYLLHPTEISQELLDLINSALLSSILTVTYDSKGNLRIEPDKGKMRVMFRAQPRADDQYGQKCHPSPYTSDLSDYRPETSGNGGYQSHASTELLSEIGDEEEERLQIFREILKQSSENPKNRTHMKKNSSMKSYTGTTVKHTASSSLNRHNSLASFQDSKSVSQEPMCYNRSSLHGHTDSVQCMTLNGDVDSEEGVLIDKGRWLLKENHLIRKSPPVSMGMYGNGDTTSPDTGQDNMSEDTPYQYYEKQNSPLAAISSSELEDMAKPPRPKCTYFNMPHSSGSDPLLDAQSLNGSKSGGDTKRNKEFRVSPMGEPSKMWARKNGSLSSFASVEFKLPDGKVHPQDGAISGAVNTNRSQSIDSRTMQEEESRVGLNLRCGQHCPIL